MPDPTQKPVLLTGASGRLGTVLAAALGAAGWTLRLTDLAPFPGELPPNASFAIADLADPVAIERLAAGCGTILHFGGVSTERPYDEIRGPNLDGMFNILEAARRERARLVFASSNHTVGFYPRDTTLDTGCPFRPDSFYGLSKAFGELMARLYQDKHGVETVSIRIGSARAEPVDARMLATWLSLPDLIGLVIRAATAEAVGHSIIWGTSRNSAMTWWRDDARATLGWSPIDSSDGWAPALAGRSTGDAEADRRQGGRMCVVSV